MYRYLIYRTDFGNTIVRESTTDNPGANEASLYTDFIIPQIQPLYLWRVVTGDVVPNTESNISDWLEEIAPPPQPDDLVTYTQLTGITNNKIDKVTGATGQVPVFTSNGNLEDSGYSIADLLSSGVTYNIFTGYTAATDTRITGIENDITYISGVTDNIIDDISYISGITDNIIDDITYISGITDNIIDDITYISGITDNIIDDITYISGVTDTKLDTNIFTGYTATTQPILNAALTGVTNLGTGTTLGGVSGRNVTIKSISVLGGLSLSGDANNLIISGDTGGISSVEWGDITGNIEDQTDLWGILTGKTENDFFTGYTATTDTRITGIENDITYISGITDNIIDDITYISGITDNVIDDITYISGVTDNIIDDITYISGITDTKLDVISFTGYSATTDTRITGIENDITYISGITDNIIDDITYISGITDTKLNTIIFTGYTATTKPILDAALTGATNGLTVEDNVVKLGGNLIENTVIGLNENEFLIRNQKTGLDSGNGFKWDLADWESKIKDVVEENNTYIIVGRFEEYNNQYYNSIISLNKNGTINTDFSIGDGFIVSGILANVNRIVKTPNNKYLVGGNFSYYNNNFHSAIVQLNMDGTVDTSFNSGSGFQAVSIPELNDIVFDNNRILVVGFFNSYSGVTKNGIIALNLDGTIDYTFNIGTGFTVDSGVDRILLDSDGKYVIGGYFTTYTGATHNRIIRLNKDGSVDNTFNKGTGFDNAVESIIEDSDGKYVIVGGFTQYSGLTGHGRIIRLNKDGSVDSTFNTGTGFGGTINSIIEDSDGKYLIGGYFTTYTGATHNRIIRLNKDGSVDNTFNKGTGFDNAVTFFRETNDGDYLIGGFFNSYTGETHNKIIKLRKDGSINNDASEWGIILSGQTFQYVNNVSEYYTNRSLVDKEYVDISIEQAVSGLTGNTYVNINVFTGYTATTDTRITGIEDDITYISGITDNIIDDITYISGITDTKLDTDIFTGYTADTEIRFQSIEEITDVALTGATNGLTISTRNVELGGILTKNTVISGTSYDFSINAKTIQLIGTGGIDIIDTDSLGINIESDTGVITLAGNDVTSQPITKIEIGENILQITDDRLTPIGIIYSDDYSLTYTNRSLVDKAYVDAIASGLIPKANVQAVTTISDGNIDLTGGTFGGTIDGYSVLNGDRILITEQTNAVQNGIYVFSAGTNTFTRSTDFDGSPYGEVSDGNLIPVLYGDTLYNTIWVLVTPNPITVGVTSLNFTLFSTPLNLIEGVGIIISGNTISVDGDSLAGNSISWTGNTFNVDIESGTLATALNSKLDTIIFTGYTATTNTRITGIENDIIYISGVTDNIIDDITYISGITDTKLDTDIFTGYTASTANKDKKIMVISSATTNLNTVAVTAISWTSVPYSADSYLWSGGSSVFIKQSGTYEIQYHVTLKTGVGTTARSIGGYLILNNTETITETATATISTGANHSSELSLPPVVRAFNANDKIDLVGFRIGGTGTINTVPDSVYLILNRLTYPIIFE